MDEVMFSGALARAIHTLSIAEIADIIKDDMTDDMTEQLINELQK